MAQAQLTQAGAPKLPKVYLPRLAPVAPTVKLLSGYEMPQIGFGTWQIKPNATYDRVRDALDSGYRHIDCSPAWRNQDKVAEAVRRWADDRGVEKSEVFISSKIWNTYHSHKNCLAEVDRILEEIDMPYIDLMTIQWPYGWAEDRNGDGDHFYSPRGPDNWPAQSNIDYLETWKALESAQKRGKIRSIGFCNFNLQQAERIWQNCEIKPSVAMVELHPYFNQLEYRRWCQERGIWLVAHAPLGNPGSNLYRNHTTPNLLQNETLQRIAKSHDKTVPQVILRWMIEHDLAAVVKSSQYKPIRDNIMVFEFKLTKEDISRIDNLNRNLRIINPQVGNNHHPHYPWPHKRTD